MSKMRRTPLSTNAATRSGMSGSVMEKKVGRIPGWPSRDATRRDHRLEALVGLAARAAVADDEDSHRFRLVIPVFHVAVFLVHDRCSQQQRK